MSISERIYRSAPTADGDPVDLKMYVHQPTDANGERRPAMIFFFGGGWQGGRIEQFAPQAEYFASRGLVTVRADYRVFSRHGTTPEACVADAQAAVRYLRANAEELGIDPDRIVGSGGSAGAHLAFCCAQSPSLDRPDADAPSARPDVLVLFNPVAKLHTGGVLAHKMAHDPDAAASLSPVLQCRDDLPPMIALYGDQDKYWKLEGLDLQKAAEPFGARFLVFPGQDHGFFNRSPYLEATMLAADRFLIDNGYLEGDPTITVPPEPAATA